MGAFWDTIKNLHPIIPAGAAANRALTVGEPIQTEPLPQTGQAAANLAKKEAVASGEAARQEAIKRGKGE